MAGLKFKSNIKSDIRLNLIELKGTVRPWVVF